METTGKTYNWTSDENKNILINSAGNKIKQHCSVSIPENMKAFPTLYWRLIIHKSPVRTKSLLQANTVSLKF